MGAIWNVAGKALPRALVSLPGWGAPMADLSPLAARAEEPGSVLLEIDGLVAGYGRTPISQLDEMRVSAGDAALLCGDSGAGKTTLLLAIAGLSECLHGQIVIGNTSVSALSPRGRDRHRGQHIGLVFQDLHLASGMTALDNMLLAPFAASRPADRRRAANILEDLGLGHRLHARAETLSRGEAQRVAIARALLLDPLLILADEPTASLDDGACAAVLDLLLTATREARAALVIATHDARVKARIPNIVPVRPVSC